MVDEAMGDMAQGSHYYRLAGLKIAFSQRSPARRLEQLSDEPLFKRKFKNLDALEATLSTRCVVLSAMPEVIHQHTLFHWWSEA